MKAKCNFTMTRNGPKVFVKLLDDCWQPPEKNFSVRCMQKDKRCVVEAAGYKEGKDYDYVMNPWTLKTFLMANEISTQRFVTTREYRTNSTENLNVVFDNNQPIVWYEFDTNSETQRCTSLIRSRKFMQEWAENDYPTLRKYTTNQKRFHLTSRGTAAPVFETKLIDTDSSSVLVDEEITDSEMEAVMGVTDKNCEIGKTVYCLQLVCNGQMDDIYTIERRVGELERGLNDAFRTPSLKFAIEQAQKSASTSGSIHDSGWLTWRAVTDSKLDSDMRVLIASKFRTNRDLHIRMPAASQSVFAQAKGADIVCQYAKEKFGADIRYLRHLD